MREKHQTAEWEDYFKIIDLLGEGEFVAVRRWQSDDRILYEGCFWDAAAQKRRAAYLDVRIGRPTLWIDAVVILRRYEIYEDVKSGVLYFFIFDGDGHVEFYSKYIYPTELHRTLLEFHSTGTVADWKDTYWAESEESAQEQLQMCRESDRFFLVADHKRTYLRERYAFLQQQKQK